MPTITAPSSDVELFTDEALTDPFPAYKEIRDAGPAVYLSRYDVYAIGRYAPLRTALSDWETFSSAGGIGLNDLANQATKGLIIATDPPEHTALRNVLAERLAPRALRALAADIERQAAEIVDPLVARGSFDAVADLARAFPVQVVLGLVGLPDVDGERALSWADAAFSASGPLNEKTLAAFPLLQDQFAYLATEATIEKLTPGSLGRAIHEAAAEGKIKQESVVPLLSAYVTAGLDTTINAISNAVHYFAEYPEQWDLVRANPALIPAAFNEVVRIDSPIQFFCRVTTKEVDVDGVTLPEGARVMMLYPSSGRDERRWENPDQFDVTRPDSAEHLGFSYGLHGCAGQGLARLEGHAMLSALARRVARFETGEPVRRLNQLVRGLAALPTTVEVA